jgi:very-short-patch-repair endonuclease
LSIPKAESPGECAFALHCKVEKLNPVREFKFHPDRKWRLDFCFREHMLAVEIEGLRGRHQTIGGFIKDIEKYNAATLLGYRVLRFTTQMVTSGEAIELTLAALKGKG